MEPAIPFRIRISFLLAFAWLTVSTGPFRSSPAAGRPFGGQGEPSGQEISVPVDYFDGIRLDQPLPARLATGQVILLKGSVEDVAIPEIAFVFMPKYAGQEGIREHRVRVVGGRFEHRIFFTHGEADTYALEIWFFPHQAIPYTANTRFLSIEVAPGTGEIQVPGEFYDSLIDNASFAPNVITAKDRFLPPLSIRTGGLVRRVTAFVVDTDNREIAYELQDDGLHGDPSAGDGIYTLTGVPYPARELDMGDWGHLRVGVEILYDNRAFTWEAAECGIVDAADLSLPIQLDEGVSQTDYIVNLVDDGTLFRASGEGIDLKRVCQRFYEYFPDAYDFLVIRSALPLANGVHGTSLNVRNPVEGIGRELYDDSALFGSRGMLRSVVFINFRSMGPIVHELAHTWANYLALFNSERYGGHWLLSDVTGVLGGDADAYEDLGDGYFAVYEQAYISHWGGRYADLELYLMGLLPAAQVAPHTVLTVDQFVTFDETHNRQIVTGRLDTVTIEDIIAHEGPRIPDVENAPHSFRMATVVVSREPLGAVAASYYDRQAAFLASGADHDWAFSAATGYRATLDTKLDPSITAILAQEQGAGGLPPSPRLRQNYPNPFNSETVIRFALPVAGKVELALINLAGQQVATLVQGMRPAGTYAVRWDGTDETGQALASGVYLYRLQVGNGKQVQTRKLLLLR